MFALILSMVLVSQSADMTVTQNKIEQKVKVYPTEVECKAAQETLRAAALDSLLKSAAFQSVTVAAACNPEITPVASKEQNIGK